MCICVYAYRHALDKAVFCVVVERNLTATPADSRRLAYQQESLRNMQRKYIVGGKLRKYPSKGIKDNPRSERKQKGKVINHVLLDPVLQNGR